MALSINVCALTNLVPNDPCASVVGDDCTISIRTFVVRICEDNNTALLAGAFYYCDILNLNTGQYAFQGLQLAYPQAGPSTCYCSSIVYPTIDFPAATYQIFVSSPSTGQSVSQTVVMPDPAVTASVGTFVTDNTACSGGNGEITVSFSGYIPFQYRITLQGSGGGQPPNIPLNNQNPLLLSNLVPGLYYLAFDYSEPWACTGCTGRHGGTIIKYVTVGNASNSINIAASSTNEVCGDGSGTITIYSISSQNAPYTFQWTGPGGFTSTSQDLTGLFSGTYTLVLTDNTGCTGTVSVDIVSLPDQNGCITPVVCYKAINCDPDCFGTKVYYLTGSQIAPLSGYIINGLQIDGEVIDPAACWTILETDPSESDPGQAPACYNNLEIGLYGTAPNGIRNCTLTVNGTSIYTGNTTFIDTVDFVTAILTPGNLSNGFTATSSLSLTAFNLCPPDWTYSNAYVTVGFEWYSNAIKDWVGEQITVQFGPGVAPTGCYTALNFLGYYTVFSTCELCAPPSCPEEPPFVKIIPDPVKIFYQIRESNCDITATKQFATAYSNMLKKIKYGIADCCNGLNIAETWVNKQISNLQATIVPGYNCRTVPMDGCSWLPLQGCEILASATDGTSILARAGEDIVFAKLVMLQGNGLIYLNQPLVETTYQRAIGFTTMDVVMNATTRVLVNGVISNPAWNLTTGAIYFAAPNGGITTVVPTTGISQMIGIAVNPVTLFVDIKQPNILC